LLCAPATLRAEPRLALVIGNSAYGSTLGALPNPARDAVAMSAALRSAGFEVVALRDLDQRAMRRAISEFGQRVSRAGTGATALFFYAGHGLQFRGVNYLVPVDAAIRSEADIELEAVAADTLFRQMEEAGAETRIMILDACRNTPVLRATRSVSRGLAPMEAPGGSFIAYSTAPGRTAADGNGRNSPFVTALVREMALPGETIEGVFRNVRRAVMAATAGEQMPWDASSLLGQFVFTRRAGSLAPDAAAAQSVAPPAGPSLPTAAAAREEPAHSAQRFGIEISVESLTETANRYVVALWVRNLSGADSVIAVQIRNSYAAELYLSDGAGGSCQMASNGEGWGSLRGYGPQNYDPAGEIARSGAPIAAGGASRHTIFFNKPRCDTLLTEREGLSMNGTFYVAVDGEPQPFPVSFDGLTMRRSAAGRR
jgi:uncharacterized caspase-like protein